jgi:hypothetical protein
MIKVESFRTDNFKPMAVGIDHGVQIDQVRDILSVSTADNTNWALTIQKGHWFAHAL